MVTLINTKNRAKYQVLFDKAEKALVAASQAGTLPAGINIDTLEIATLNQYFAYLKDLIQVSSSEDIKRYFTRLPLDEDFFEIDANSRNIKVPAVFNRNGVGVQGDEMAEIVYFTIDRYFDSMDLANNEMNIVIQWEAKDANKQTIVGISPNYGKDIETIPGKIIFGWPIYSELTQTAGTVKFAVRFFALGEADENGTRALEYSLATLPAEVTINQTLNYDLIAGGIKEIDRGKVITGRIKNTGIYDPSIPTPGEPIISTPLYVVGENNTVKIVDLPAADEAAKKFAISAKPADFGAIQYDWKQYPYDTVTGEYSNNTITLTSNVDNGVYEEVVEIGDDVYYRIASSAGVTPVVYEPIDPETFLSIEDGEYNYDADQGFEKADGGFVKVYKKLSVATINQVGIYTVNVGARAGVNVVEKKMAKEDGIVVPGPLKPEINTPEADEHVSITEEDKGVHIIVDNDKKAVLKVLAAAGETGKPASEVGEDPQVALSYVWKQKISEDETQAIGAVSAVAAQVIPAESVFEPGRANQAACSIVQTGNQVVIYGSGLDAFLSTDETQADAPHEWVAIDIDTHKASIIGVTWNGGELGQSDVDDATSVGLGAGHIVYWAKADQLALAPRSIAIGLGEDEVVNLVVSYREGAPSVPVYTFNADHSELVISNLVDENLDDSYFVEVTSTRNNVPTAKESGIYRITNAPEKPVLKYRVWNGNAWVQEVKDYLTEENAIQINKKNRAGAYNKLAFSVEPMAQSDKLSYVWMKANIESDLADDWINDAQPKLQIDLDDLLPDLFSNKPGAADIPVDGDFGLSTLPELGQVVPNTDNGPAYEMSESTKNGYYYCIVINELNNNRTANVSPFFHVTD